jgi:hypothetical protein
MPDSVLPYYGSDIRRLVTEAFGPPMPVMGVPLPGGPLPERISQWRDCDARGKHSLVGIPGLHSAADVSLVTNEEYWRLALPHRVFVIAPLLDLVEEAACGGDAAERAVLEAYNDEYLQAPLSAPLLSLLARVGARSGVLEWLEDARIAFRELGVDEAVTRWAQLRVDAVRRGMRNWTDVTTCIAELTVDVLLLLRATREDCVLPEDAAVSLRAAVAARDAEQSLVFEDVLRQLFRRSTLDPAVPISLRQPLAAFHNARPDHAHSGILRPDWKPRPRRVLPAPRQSPAEKPETGTPSAAPSGVTPSGSTPNVAPTVVRNLASDYRTIVGSLRRSIVGRDELCRRLALAGAAHLSGATHQRILLCGASGSGKTHAAQELALAVGAPYALISAADLSETGWKGLNISDALGGILRQHPPAPGAPAPVLVIDEFDKVRIRSSGGWNTAAEARWGLQSSLLGLLDGLPVSIEDGTSGFRQVTTSSWLIVATGAFGGRFRTPPSTADLVRWGFMPELAERLSERIHLPPPSAADARRLLALECRSRDVLIQSARAAGLQIRIAPETLALAAHLWLRAPQVGFRSAAEWINSAIRDRLIDRLDSAAEGGEPDEVVITPDDLRVRIA